MTLFISLMLRAVLPLTLPWLLCLIAVLSGEWAQAAQLLLDGIVAPVRLVRALFRPRPVSLVSLRLQQPTMAWRAR